MQAVPLLSLLNKLHLLSLTQRRSILIQIVAFTCVLHVLGLFLGHPQARQYKNLTQEDMMKISTGPLVYRHYFL